MHVTVYRDSGYGVIKKVDKGKCTQVLIAAGQLNLYNYSNDFSKHPVKDRLKTEDEIPRCPRQGCFNIKIVNMVGAIVKIVTMVGASI